MERNTNIPTISARIDKLSDSGKTRAFASVVIGGAFAIHGIRVVDSDQGAFVAMPQDTFKTKNGEVKYQDRFHPVTAEARSALVNAVMDAYEQKLEQEPEMDAPTRGGMQMC